MNYEVLFLLDPIDQYSILSLAEYQGKRFSNLAKDDFRVTTEDFYQQQEQHRLETIFNPLIDWIQNRFNETVEKVILSQRLVKSSMVLIAGRHGYDGQLERLGS